MRPLTALSQTRCSAGSQMVDRERLLPGRLETTHVQVNSELNLGLLAIHSHRLRGTRRRQEPGSLLFVAASSADLSFSNALLLHFFFSVFFQGARVIRVSHASTFLFLN